MRGAREIVRGAILALLAAAFFAAPAQAELEFSPPQTLASGAVGSQQMAVDAQGRATLVFLDATNSAEGMLVRVVRVSPNGLPGPIHTLEAIPPDPPLGRCICPRIAVDPSGRAVATWQTVVEDDRRVAAALIDSSGEPEPPRLLSPPGVAAANPRVEANEAGIFAVAWQVNNVEGRIEAALVSPEGVFGEAHALNVPGERGAFPYLAAGPEGDFHVAWEQEERINATVLDEEGNADPAEPVSPEGETAFLSGIVVDSMGRTTIAWWHPDGAYEAKAVRLDADGVPGSVRTLQPPDQNVGSPEIAIDGQDRVTAAWETFSSRIYAVRLGADGVPGESQPISPEGHSAGGPQIAAAPDGRVIITWDHPAQVFIPEESCGVTELDPEDDVVRAAMLDSAGTVDRLYDVSAHGEEALGMSVAFDQLGLPLVAWESYDGTYFCEDVSGRIQFSHGFESQEQPGGGSDDPLPPGPGSRPPLLTLGKRAVAQGGRVRIKVRCSGSPEGTCFGSLRLSTLANLPGHAPGSTRKRRMHPVARGRYAVAAGEEAILELPLSKTAKRFIAARKPGRIASIASSGNVPPTKVLIRVIGPKT